MSPVPDRLTAALADRYRIERELGAGGMATVYLAQDLKHDRKVAIKVLRPELAAVIGAERFLSEIRTTANLQHSHILPLFDSGAADSFLFYVMPFIEGESLRDRLNREKQLPIADAVRIATEVASALDYAHRHNVIHRDIKPENVMLHDGQALVADFGIALAASKAGGTRMTETGMSLGTPTYMSPEQAMGEREITARSDIYALGAMTYEMLLGEPPFTGPTAQSIVAKVMTERPASISARRETVPLEVEHAVLTALAKLPADRWGSAAEFSAALRGGVTSRSATDIRPHLAPAGNPRALPPAALVATIAAVVFAVAAGVLALRLANSRSSGGSGTVRFSIDLDKTDHLNSEPALALSPDGSQLVVSGNREGKNQLFVHRMDRADFVPIPGTEGGTRPFFSPDGRWIGFYLSSISKVMKIPAEGGAAVAIADATWGGGTWGPDGTIVYSLSYKGGIWRLPPGGGKAEAVTSPDTAKGELAHWWPQFLPDGRHVLFTNFSTPIDRAKIEVVDLKTGARKVLVSGGVFGRYVSAGYLLYARGETMLAQPFDPGSLTTSGSAVVVVEDVAMSSSNGIAGYTISANGTLAFVPASAFLSGTQPVWVDRGGAARSLLTQPGSYCCPRLSPEAGRVALSVWQPARNGDVWTYEITRNLLTRLTFNDAADFNPLWTLDGRELIYTSERPVFDLYRRSANASTAEEPLFASQYDKYAGSISPDGKLLAFSTSPPGTSEIWLLPLDGSGKARPFLQNKFTLFRPAFSPDGHWLSYDSDESGGRDVYLQSFPDPARTRRQVSVGGGADAHWTQGGRELVYRNGDSVLTVTVNPVSGETSRPVKLFTGAYATPAFATHSYDVTADGRRFLMIKQPPELAPRRIDLVLGWLEELKRKAGTAP